MRPEISTAFATAAVAITLQAGALILTATPSTAAPQAQTQRAIRATGGDRAVQQIATRIRRDSDALRRALGNNRSGTDRSGQSSSDLQYAIDDVVAATDHLADHSSRNQVMQLDVDDVMRRGGELGDAIEDANVSSTARNAWSTLQRDLEAVSSAFGQNWNWRNPTYSSTSDDASGRLNGTYELDSARSDNPTRVLNQAMRQQQANRRGRTRKDVEPRLNPPAVIAIERNGNNVTVASSDAPRTTFDASGRVVSERRGAQNSTMRASVYGDRVEVTTSGSGVDDYSVTFEPLDGGRSLSLTRELHVENLTQPVVIRSVYRRTSDRPDWNVSTSRDRVVGTSGNFGGGLEDGTILTATLDAPINLRSVRQDDRVALTVHNAPEARFENAVLEGYVSSVPNDADRAGFGIVFNRIRLSNGRTADFNGSVENVRGPNGESISFGGERVDNGDQRDTAIQRGAIGAAIGAVVGAIAGGSKGAAIGAVVGGGGGAATVLIGGQRQTELPRGTEFTVRSEGSSNWNR